MLALAREGNKQSCHCVAWPSRVVVSTRGPAAATREDVHVQVVCLCVSVPHRPRARSPVPTARRAALWHGRFLLPNTNWRGSRALVCAQANCQSVLGRQAGADSRHLEWFRWSHLGDSHSSAGGAHRECEGDFNNPM